MRIAQLNLNGELSGTDNNPRHRTTWDHLVYTRAHLSRRSRLRWGLCASFSRLPWASQGAVKTKFLCLRSMLVVDSLQDLQKPFTEKFLWAKKNIYCPKGTNHAEQNHMEDKKIKSSLFPCNEFIYLFWVSNQSLFFLINNEHDGSWMNELVDTMFYEQVYGSESFWV